MKKYSDRVSFSLDLAGIVAVLLLVGAVAGGVFLYSYFNFMGRPDLFPDATEGGRSSFYILAMICIIGIIAVISLSIPSLMIILGRSFLENNMFWRKKRSVSGYFLLLNVISIFLFLSLVFLFSYTPGEKNLSWLIFLYFMLSAACSFVLFKICGYKIKNRHNGYPSPCRKWLIIIGSVISLGVVVFTYGISSSSVMLIVLRLGGWGDSLLDYVCAFIMCFLSAVLALLPAAMYLSSRNGPMVLKSGFFVLGAIIFYVTFLTVFPQVGGASAYGAANLAKFNDDRVWEYLIDKEIEDVFSEAEWKVETGKSGIIVRARLMYGLGGVRVLCPPNVEVNVKKEEFSRDVTIECRLVSANQVNKRGLVTS